MGDSLVGNSCDLLAFWPGVLHFDAKMQTSWLLTGEAIYSQHPVLHTLWLSVPMLISNKLTGSFVFGYAFYTISQMMAFSGLLVKIVQVVNRWGFKPRDSFALWLTFTLFPVFPFWSTVATKDVIFSGLFALCFVSCVDFAMCKRERERESKYGFKLFLLFLLTCLFRNNFVFALALFVILILVFGSKLKIGRARIAVLLVCVCAVYFFISGPIFTAAGIKPCGTAETMSVPAQQLASVAVEAPNVTEEEMGFIQTYVPTYKNLDETLADPVKNYFSRDEMKEDPLKFFLGYLKIGIAHPNEYISAYFKLEINYFLPSGSNLYSISPDKSVNAFCEYSNAYAPEKYIEVPQSSFAPHFAKLIKMFLTGKVPILTQLYQCGFWIWTLVFLFGLACHYRRPELAFSCVFVMCYWVTVVFGPTFSFRYTLPLITCAPILVVLLLGITSKPHKTPWLP